MQTGRTPLHYVIGEKDGDDELIDMLLKHKADTNLGDSVSFFYCLKALCILRARGEI